MIVLRLIPLLVHVSSMLQDNLFDIITFNTKRFISLALLVGHYTVQMLPFSTRSLNSIFKNKNNESNNIKEWHLLRGQFRIDYISISKIRKGWQNDQPRTFLFFQKEEDKSAVSSWANTDKYFNNMLKMIENIWFYIDAQRSNILNKSSIQGQ